MDQEEKQLVQEANALRHRELDIAEKRTAALLAIGRATLVTIAALAAAGWGISVLAQADIAWGRGIGFASIVSAVILMYATCFAAINRDRVWRVYAALLMLSVFLLGISLSS